MRSARLIDIELPAMYDAMLAFSGASVGVNQRLNASDFSDRLLRAAEPGFYRTGDTTKPFEHTLYTVSYTHLDVYKRQAPYLPHRRRPYIPGRNSCRVRPARAMSLLPALAALRLSGTPSRCM